MMPWLTSCCWTLPRACGSPRRLPERSPSLSAPVRRAENKLGLSEHLADASARQGGQHVRAGRSLSSWPALGLSEAFGNGKELAAAEVLLGVHR